MKNCTSLAFKLETAIDPEYSEDISASIAKMAAENGRRIREIENEHSPLEKGEWMVVFFGFWSTRSMLSPFDYHFVLRQDDGTWIQQDRGDIHPYPAKIKEMIKDAKQQNIFYQFYAVSKT